MTLEQRHAELFLQIADVQAHSRLAEKQPARGDGEVLGLCRLDKDVEFVKVKHGSIEPRIGTIGNDSGQVCAAHFAAIPAVYAVHDILRMNTAHICIVTEEASGYKLLAFLLVVALLVCGPAMSSAEGEPR